MSYADQVARLRQRLGGSTRLDIGDQKVEFDAAAELPVRTDNPAALQDEATTISAQLFYFLRLEALARRLTERAEAEYRVWRDGRVAAFYASDAKKATKDAAEAHYRTDPAYPGWQERLRRAEQDRETLSAVVECVRLKSQMIKEVARLLIAEAGGDLRNMTPRVP